MEGETKSEVCSESEGRGDCLGTETEQERDVQDHPRVFAHT